MMKTHVTLLVLLLVAIASAAALSLTGFAPNITLQPFEAAAIGGIAVLGQTSLEEIKTLVDGIGNGIGKRLKAVEDTIDGIVKKDARRLISGEGPGREFQTDEGRILKSLHGVQEIKAYYGRKGSEECAQVTLADFTRAIAGFSASEDARKAMSIGTDPSGGYAVPSHLQAQILSALVPQSSLLNAGVGVVPMEGADMDIARVTSIPTAVWRGEGGAIAESEPALGALTIAPRSLAFYFKVSRELLADADNIDAALSVAMAQSFARELDRAGLRGSGAAQPTGILNASGRQSVTNGTDGAALTSYANFGSAALAILEADAPMPTAAIMSPRSLVKLGMLASSGDGQPLQTPTLLKSMRWLSTTAIPNNLTVGANSDCSEIYVADFTNAMFFMRENVSIAVLKEAFATTGQIGFVGHVRADFAMMYRQAFAVVTGVR